MTERRHRGSRRYEAAPTHLPGEPATGDVQGWRVRQADADAQADALTGTPGHASGPDAGQAEERAKTQPDDARGAWFRSQRPPHWG